MHFHYFLAGGYRHDQATTALLRMIAVDNMPLCTTERPGFKKFVKILQPLYHIPCEPTLTNAMSRKYQDLSNKIKLELQQTESVCLTTDIWTHQHTMKSYLGLTVHYLKGQLLILFSKIITFSFNFKYLTLLIY